MAWDALYEAQPTDSTYVADTDDAIRSVKTEIRTRFANEHGFNLSESSPQTGHGKHLRGSARAFVSDTSVVDPTTVTADDANYATGRLQVYPTLKRLGYYSGSAWIDLIRDSSGDFEARVLKSTVATGTAPLTVASSTKVTNFNADLLDGFDPSTSATASTIALRDSSGRLKAVAPSATTDVALLSNVVGWDVIDYSTGSETLQTITLGVGETKTYAWVRTTASQHELGVGSTGTYRGILLYKTSLGNITFESFSRINSALPLINLTGFNESVIALVVLTRVS